MFAWTSRQKGTALLCLLAGLCIWGSYCGPEQEPAPASPEGAPGRPAAIWFDDLDAAAHITHEDGLAMARRLPAGLQRRQVVEIPEPLRHDAQPRIVFVTAGSERMHAKVAIGAGRGIADAVRSAIADLRGRIPEGVRTPWIRLDVVTQVRAVGADEVGALYFDPGVEGMAFGREAGVAFAPGEVLGHDLIDDKGKVQPDAIRSYCETVRMPDRRLHEAVAAGGVAWVFTTSAWFTDGREVVGLYRGHRMRAELRRDELLEAAKAAGAYLTRAVLPTGKFIYAYDPKRDVEAASYNMVRHAGTLYSMMELYRETRDPLLLAAAERGFEFMRESVSAYTFGGADAAAVVEKDKVKLGGTALAAVALAEYIKATERREAVAAMQSLCRSICEMQKDTGEFISQRRYSTGAALSFVSQYYPGEAILALVRAHSVDGQEKWLDAAARGARYLIHVRDGNVPTSELAHDHWLLYALNDLYRVRRKPEYLRHARRLAGAIYDSQCRATAIPDHLGSYYRPPRSTPTATRSEGLLAAYLLFRDNGLQEEARMCMDAAQLGAAFVLQMQFRPESVLYVAKPWYCLGGVHGSLTSFELRNDYTQHALSALLALHRILVEEKRNVVGEAGSAATDLMSGNVSAAFR